MAPGLATRAPSWRIAAVAWCALVAIAIGRSPRHHARAAVEVEPRSADELALILNLSVDVWTEHAAVGQPMTVVLTRMGIDALTAHAVRHRIVVEDIDAAADQERRRLATRDTSPSGWFDEYRDLQEIGDRMDLLVTRHPAVAGVRTLGRSLEGRPIRAIAISRGGKIGIALDGAQHAREWISAMVPICIADRLVAASENDPRVRRILDSVSFYIVPVVNPDGYAYSWTDDRYWRKNRRGGYGVDLNRNYSVAWGDAGSSADRRSPNYRGEEAFSEPEARAMRTLFDAESIRAHIDFHSYSQVILYPWSYQKAPPPDRDAFAAIADRVSTAIHAEHGERYTIRPGSELASGIGGTLADWAYGEKGALSILVELRPKSSRDGGFVLPPEQIGPTCDEGFAAALELAEWTIRDASPVLSTCDASDSAGSPGCSGDR